MSLFFIFPSLVTRSFARGSDEGNFRASRAVAYWRYKKGDNNSAFIYALRAAQAGDAYSQAWIADYYEQGVDITQDYQKAVYWATKSMEQNDRYGLLMYGRLLFDGHGVAVDKDKAMAVLQQSAVIGFAKAYCEIGRFHLCNGNISSALKAFKKAAREKEPLSCYQLGFRYLNGIDIPKDIKVGIRLLTIAAQKGHAESAYTLGCYYESVNTVKTLEYFKIAADAGHAYASLLFAGCLLMAEPCIRDVSMARTYFNRAKQMGVNANDKLLLVLTEAFDSGLLT